MVLLFAIVEVAVIEFIIKRIHSQVVKQFFFQTCRWLYRGSRNACSVMEDDNEKIVESGHLQILFYKVVVWRLCFTLSSSFLWELKLWISVQIKFILLSMLTFSSDPEHSHQSWIYLIYYQICIIYSCLKKFKSPIKTFYVPFHVRFSRYSLKLKIQPKTHKIKSKLSFSVTDIILTSVLKDFFNIVNIQFIKK